MTSSNGNIFRVTRPLCGEFTGPGEFPTQRPVTRSFDVFFDLRLNKRLSKQPGGWWFETQSWSLWRQCNVVSHQTHSGWLQLIYSRTRTPYKGAVVSILALSNSQYIRHLSNLAAVINWNCALWAVVINFIMTHSNDQYICRGTS